jgi:uncharacterized protein YjbJ (UPF0337 family)
MCILFLVQPCKKVEKGISGTISALSNVYSFEGRKMNKNKITGAWQKTKGKIKEEVGHATGNRKMASEGVGDQVKGKINKSLGKVKDVFKKGVDTTLGSRRAG